MSPSDEIWLTRGQWLALKVWAVVVVIALSYEVSKSLSLH